MAPAGTARPQNRRKAALPEADTAAALPLANMDPEAPPATSGKAGPKGVAAGKEKKTALAERAVNMEQELLALSAKLEKVTLEKQESEALLKERNAQLEMTAQEKEKLQKELNKLQKLKAFEPQLNLDAVMLMEEDADDKKEKDPRRPKKPTSAFLLWSVDHQPEVRKKHPQAGVTEVAKIMGELWKSVSEADKKVYEEKFAKESEKYKAVKADYDKMIAEEKRQQDALRKLQEERRKEEALKLLEQFTAHQQEMKEGAAGGKKKAKDPEKPKQPLSAFVYFCTERRPQLFPPSEDKRDIVEESKALGEEWKKIKDTKQAEKYEKMAAADRSRYAAEMDAYKAKKQQEEEAATAEKEKRKQEDMQEALSRLAKEELEQKKLVAKQVKAELTASDKGKVEKVEKKKEKDANKPKRPPTGYLLFCAAIRADLLKEDAKMPLGELSKKQGKAWQELSESEKKAWNDKAAPEAEEYKRAMEKYKLETPK